MKRLHYIHVDLYIIMPFLRVYLEVEKCMGHLKHWGCVFEARKFSNLNDGEDKLKIVQVIYSIYVIS